MQFCVTAYDYPDALEKRLAVRDEHLQLIDDLRERGICLYAARLEDEEGKPMGSVMIFECSTKQELIKLLEKEPYKVHNVWEKIAITGCKVAPKFLR